MDCVCFISCLCLCARCSLNVYWRKWPESVNFTCESCYFTCARQKLYSAALLSPIAQPSQILKNLNTREKAACINYWKQGFCSYIVIYLFSQILIFCILQRARWQFFKDRASFSLSVGFGNPSTSEVSIFAQFQGRLKPSGIPSRFPRRSTMIFLLKLVVQGFLSRAGIKSAIQQGHIKGKMFKEWSHETFMPGS